jgi:hypothetical protein
MDRSDLVIILSLTQMNARQRVLDILGTKADDDPIWYAILLMLFRRRVMMDKIVWVVITLGSTVIGAVAGVLLSNGP